MDTIKKPVRLLILAGQLGLGGAERQLFYLLSQLDPEQYTVHALNFSAGGGFYWAERLVEQGIPVTQLKTKTPFERLLYLWRFVNSWKPDIIQSFHFHINGYAAILGKLTFRPAIGGMRNLPNERHVGKTLGIWRWLSIRVVDHLVCNSRSAAQMLQERFPRLDNIVFIPNGVASVDAGGLGALRGRAIQELDKQPDELFVGFVGHLGAQKNVSLLLRAVANISSDFPHLRLISVGDGPLRDRLEREAQELGVAGITRFLGQRPQAEELMPAFDILCLPSDYEGMPNVLMEAAAAGIPVVASKVADVPLIVKEGESGLLFPPQDVQALAQNLRLLITNPELRQKMGLAAREHIEVNYSIPAMVKRYEDLYKSILA